VKFGDPKLGDDFASLCLAKQGVVRVSKQFTVPEMNSGSTRGSAAAIPAALPNHLGPPTRLV